MKNNSVRKTDKEEMSPREKEIAVIFRKVEKKYWGKKSNHLKVLHTFHKTILLFSEEFFL
jgi:hypothetical protein